MGNYQNEKYLYYFFGLVINFIKISSLASRTEIEVLDIYTDSYLQPERRTSNKRLHEQYFSQFNKSIGQLFLISLIFTHVHLTIKKNEKNMIPKKIHQIYLKGELPKIFQDNINQLKLKNPSWTYRLYSNTDAEDIILEHYGQEILSCYKRIDPKYGAARADFFRYLLLYKFGGVYLDIKSSCLVPLDDFIEPEDQYLLAQWQNGEHTNRAGWGLHKEIDYVEGGEYQQWHIIAAPRHPFLRYVIDQVIRNIKEYSPWKVGSGRIGVWRLTGPIVYTQEIHKILDFHPHRFLSENIENRLIYSIIKSGSHSEFFRHHYSNLRCSIVRPSGLNGLSFYTYNIANSLREPKHFASLFFKPRS